MGHFDHHHRTERTKKPWIETPLIESAALSKVAGCRIFLKLESLQPSGSFKSRGIGNLILSSLKSEPLGDNNRDHDRTLHFFSSSGGNAGLAAVVAARDLGCPCDVVVPFSTKQMMIEKLRAAGATAVTQHGASWFEADTYLRETFIDHQNDVQEGALSKTAPGITTRTLPSSSHVKNIYVPPFDHPEIWRGVATMVDEIAAQMPPRDQDEEEEGHASSASKCAAFPADVIVCSVGGGGLFNGVMHGLDQYLQRHRSASQDESGKEPSSAKPVQVLAVETLGADSLAFALRQRELRGLPAITSLATSLGALCVAPQTLKNAQSPPSGVEVTSVVGTDAEAARGVIRLADEHRLQVELACGISVEVAVAERLKEAVKDLTPSTRVVVVVCGGSGVTAEMIAEYRQRLKSGWE